MGAQDDEITPLPPAYNEKPSEVIQTIERADSVDESNDGNELMEPTPAQLEILRRVSEPIPLRAWYCCLSN